MAIKKTTPLAILADDPTSFVLYGEPKVGKTTLAGSFPGVAFISCPGNEALSLADHPNAGAIDIYQVEDWQDYCKALLGLAQRPRTEELQTLCVDTATHAYGFAVKEVQSKQRDKELVSQATWTEANRKFLEVLDNAAKLVYASRKNFILLAHSRVESVGKEPDITQKIRCDIGQSLRGKVYGRFNTIFYYRLIGANKRELIVKSTPNIDVGSRYKFEKNLIDPTGTSIMETIDNYKAKVKAQHG